MVRPKVLIIGGGFAGAKIATALAKDGHEVTLVSMADYFEASFANARSVVEPSIADKTLWAYQDLKPHGTFVQGEVVRLDDKSATLRDGRVLEFDYAAICTGSNYAVGKSTTSTTLQQRKAEVQALASQVAAASSVLVIGGGPLGVELAGEVLQDQPGTAVTLVHAGGRLLPTLPAKLGAAAETWLRGKGCQIIFNDRVDLPAGFSSSAGFSGTTRGGVAVSGDVVLAATGITYNSAFMREALPDTLDEQGRIKVDRHLRVIGHPNLFAVGDVTDVKEEKLAFLAAQQGEMVARSLAALLAAQQAGSKAVAAAEKKLGVWKPSNGIPIMIVTLGRSYGVGRIACITFVGWLPTLLKSRNVGAFVDKYRQQLLQRP